MITTGKIVVFYYANLKSYIINKMALYNIYCLSAYELYGCFNLICILIRFTFDIIYILVMIE